MKKVASCAVVSVLLSLALPAAAAAPASAAPEGTAGQACPALLNYTFPRLQDEVPQPLCQYRGKVVLVVNTASYCGFTGQYDGLEKMYAKYKDQGLVVLGFPSNDFGGQEPGSNKEIADFCRLTYGVKFPMLAKSDVVGSGTNPLYKQLASITGEKPKWNFHKYLIDRSGQKVLSFPSTTAPDNKTFVSAVERALAERP